MGVLLSTIYRLGRSNVKEPLTLAIALGAFVAGAFFDLNAALVVVAAGLIGIMLLSAARGGGQNVTKVRE